jgi:hypothetical protein
MVSLPTTDLSITVLLNVSSDAIVESWCMPVLGKGRLNRKGRIISLSDTSEPLSDASYSLFFMLSRTCEALVGVDVVFSNDLVKFATEVADLALLRVDAVRSFCFGVRDSRVLSTLERLGISDMPLALSFSA